MANGGVCEKAECKVSTGPVTPSLREVNRYCQAASIRAEALLHTEQITGQIGPLALNLYSSSRSIYGLTDSGQDCLKIQEEKKQLQIDKSRET